MQQDRIRISVVIPVYNGERFIAAAIESALAQDFDAFEVVVVNDGSTDASEREILRFKDDIVYIRQANQGVSAARNTGIKAARGDYIALLDQDDLFLPPKLATMCAWLDDHPDHGMVYCRLKGIDAAGEPAALKKLPEHSGDVFLPQFMECFISPSMTLCRKDLLVKAGLFDPRFSSEGEDYDLFLKMACLAPVGALTETLGCYRVHAENTSRNWADRPLMAVEQILAQHRHHICHNYPRGRRLYRKRLAGVFRNQAKASRPHQALPLYLKSIRYYPLRLKVYRELLGVVIRKIFG